MGLRTIFKTIYQYGNDAQIEEFRGKSIAIDMMTYVIRMFKSSNKNNTSWMTELLNFLRMFKKHGIKVVCVFDGYNKPSEKVEIIKERRKRINGLAQQKKELEESESKNEKRIAELNYMCSFPSHVQIEDSKVIIAGVLKIPVLIADGDGEVLCCALQKKREVDYILSEDSDILLCGAINFMCYRGGESFRYFNTSSIFKFLRINYEIFFYICLMIGSDYNVGLGYSSFKEADLALKECGLESIKRRVEQAEIDVDRIRMILSSEKCKYYQFDSGKVLQLQRKYLANF